MTRIEKLEKEIQELKLQIAKLEGRVQELSIYHGPLQPYTTPQPDWWSPIKYGPGKIGDVLCRANQVSDFPCYCESCIKLRSGLGGLPSVTLSNVVDCSLTSYPSASAGFENYEMIGKVVDSIMPPITADNTGMMRCNPPKKKKQVGKFDLCFEEEDFKIDD